MNAPYTFHMDLNVLSSAEMDTLLSAQKFGHMGCCYDDKPFIFPMAYVYHDNIIYGQTTTGQKIEILRKNPNVCFQVGLVHKHGWESAMCWGKFQELDFDDLQEKDAIKVVELLTKKIGAIQDQIGVSIPYSHSEKPKPISVNNKTSTLFRIVIEEKAGKRFGQKPAI